MNSRRAPFIVSALLIAGFLAFPSGANAGDAKSYVKVLSHQWTTKPPLLVKNVVSYSIKNDHPKKAIVVEYTVLIDGKRAGGGSQLLQPHEGYQLNPDTSGKPQMVRIDSATFQ